MVFHWSLSDSKSPQVSRTPLSILAVLNNALIWMVSTHLPTSKSSNPFCNPLLLFQKHQLQLSLLFTPLEFFTSVLADGPSQEFEWQQVSSSL